MSNIQASSLPFRKAATAMHESGMFIRLHQKTRHGPHVQRDHADLLIRHHFLLGVQGENTAKLAAAGAVIIPDHASLPFRDQMAGIILPEKTALLCLTAYSTRLVGNPRRWAEEDLLEGARQVARGRACTGLLAVLSTRESAYATWKTGGIIPL